MPSCIKIRSKSIISIFLILLFLNLKVKCQAQELQPEITLDGGLQSNAVRVIKLDKQSRIWVGTDEGLNILSTNLISQKHIINAVGNQSIWDIAFDDSLVFIGTRFDGLYIFNQLTGGLYQHLPSSTINLIRKIKIFGKDIFILTNNGTYQWSLKSLKNLQLKSIKELSVSQYQTADFISDIFYWNGNLFAVTYPHGFIYKYENDTFDTDCTNEFFPSGITHGGLLCAKSDGDKIVLGGDRFYQIVTNKNIRQKFMIPQIKGSNYAVWDIAFIKNKILFALGETISNQKGFIYENGSPFKENKSSETGFLTSFAYDFIKDCLYYGSLTEGLFLRKGISGNRFINTAGNTKFIANQKYIFGYNENSFDEYSPDEPPKKVNTKNNAKEGTITDLKLFGDTLGVTSEFSIKFYDAKTLKLLYKQSIGFDKVESIKNQFYFFMVYGTVEKFNFKNNKFQPINNVQSFLPYPQIYKDKIIFLNREKGFNIIEKDTAYPLICKDKSIAFSSDYTIINNTLYTLIRNTIKSYKIDCTSQQLILLHTYKIDSIIEGFSTKWIISKNDQLYLINDQGILQLEPSTAVISSYFYFGNYKEIQKPVIYDDSLIIATQTALTKIAFKDIGKQEIADPKNIKIDLPETINENLVFIIGIDYPDYLIQNHAIKKLALYRDGKMLNGIYTLNNQFHFPAGLKYGSYELHIFMGNAEKRQSLDITLPWNRNPKFFIAIIIIILAILFLLIKNWFDRKEFTKRLTQSRLQVLKQNLNPHFVFNSMNLISSLILEGKNDEAIKVVSEFSNLQRTYLETNNKESITLKEELDFLRSYLQLQQTRFYHDNEFEFFISIDPSIDPNTILLPPLILQPLAENAVKYGVIGSDAIEKKIWVDIKGNNPLIISIEDNGTQANPGRKGFGLGHQIVQERISLFKSPISFFKSKSPMHSASGYSVEIHVGKGV